MGKITDWFKTPSPPLEGGIDPVHSKSDVQNAATGHMPIAGTNVEVVVYCKGDDLVLLVNKGPCIFRTTLAGAFRDDLDPMQCNVLMRDDLLVLGEITADMRELANQLMR